MHKNYEYRTTLNSTEQRTDRTLCACVYVIWTGKNMNARRHRRKDRVYRHLARRRRLRVRRLTMPADTKCTHTHTLHALSIVSHLCNAHKHYRSKTTIFNKLHTQCTYALTHSNTHTTIYARACYTGAINYTCILSTYIMHVRYVRNYSTSHHREHLIIYIFRSRLTWLTSGRGDGIDGGGCTTALACDDSVTTPSRLVLRAQLRADVAHTNTHTKTVCNLCRMAGNWVVSTSADGIAMENREYISAKWTAAQLRRLHSNRAECGRQSLESAD